ncbi:MAG: methyltransferase domain-containing protein [Bryobacteraceae bacterium]
MAAAAASAGAPDYGLDSPAIVKEWYGRAGWTFAFGLLLWFMNRQEYPGPAVTLLITLALIAAVMFGIGWFMNWSSRVGKVQARDKILDSLELKGGEKVLDAGCGRGLMAIGIAKKLSKAGKVTAMDVWDTNALSGNLGDATRENVKNEGVTDRVRVENGDMRKMPYPDGNFDVVVSTWALHHIQEETDRDQAVRELLRVTKSSGRIVIADTHYPGRYADILRQARAEVTVSPLGLLWCLPAKSVVARKP